MLTFFNRKFTRLNSFYLKAKAKIQRILFNWVNSIYEKGFSKNPFFCFLRRKTKLLFGKEALRLKNGNFYFGLMSIVLLGSLFISSDSLAQDTYANNSNVIFFNSFFKNTDNLTNNDLFFSQNKELALETPDLKIIQDNSIYAVSTPSILTTQTLGDIFGGSDEQRKEIVEYQVQIGDTIAKLANDYNITPETIASANGISKNAALKVGQTIVILPVSGVVHIVKPGDVISQIAKTYKAKADDIVAFNNLAGEGDIFIGDSLIIPNGVMPAKPVPSFITVPLADNFFIYPAEGLITQGLHYYNGVDLANKVGTPIYAAASGVVQRAVADGFYHGGMGNHISILHSNGTVTYYGHLQTVFVKSGDRVGTGDRIGLMGQTGRATGPHVHFEVIGAQNPLAKFLVGSVIKYK